MLDDVVRPFPTSSEAFLHALLLEGIGQVQTSYVGIETIAAPLAPLPDPSWPRRIGSTLGMVGRGLPHVLPHRRPRTLASAG